MSDELFLSEETAKLFKSVQNERGPASEPSDISDNTQEKSRGPTPSDNEPDDTPVINNEKIPDNDSPQKEDIPPQEEVSTDISDVLLPDGDIKPKKKRKLLTALWVLWGVMFFLAACYFGRMKYYETHFFRNTKINGTDVSGCTAEQVKEMVAKSAEVYKLKILERNGLSEEISASDIGLKYVDDGNVDEILSKQDVVDWYRKGREEKAYIVGAGTTYDTVSAENAVRALKCFTDPGIVMPENAVMQKNAAGLYEIIPEEKGDHLKQDAVQAIMDAITERAAEIDLEALGLYEEAAIKKDDKNLNATVNKLNAYLTTTVTYVFGNDTETISTEEIEPHITNLGGEISVNTDWVYDFVATWAAKYDSFGLSREFITHDGNVVTVPDGGDYGWCMDIEETAAQVAAHIKNAESGEFEAVWKYSAKGWDNNSLTGTYVEVSIDRQKLWLYKDGTEILETDVVTGKATPERETIRGCFAVDAKKSPAVLGSLDVQGYESPVNYWAPFNGGQGLHDAPWRGSFGGSIYLDNGSHGCVNIPEDVMGLIYETIDIGTAVVVY